MIDVGFLHHRQELTRIGRKRLDIAALAFCIQGVECQRRLAGAGQSGDDYELVAGDSEAYIF